jgi:hypothetical protein
VIESNVIPSMLATRRIGAREYGTASASLRVRTCVMKGRCMTDERGEAGVEFGADSQGQFDFSRSMKMLHWPSEDTTISEFFPVLVIYYGNQKNICNI